MSLMWSIGALLELPERKKMQEYLKENYPSLNFPPCRPNTDDTIFDFVVDSHGMIPNNHVIMFRLNLYDIE